MKLFSENSNIGLRHLRAALAVEAHGSFSAAASALGVVPSALTTTVHQIEAEAGIRLFDRGKRPIRPTQAGRAFLGDAARIVRQFDAAMTGLRISGGLKAGHVAVAAIPSALGAFLTPALKALRRDHPDLKTTIYDGIGEFTERMVLTERAELGLTARWSTRQELEGVRLAAEPFVVVCHADHELARKAEPLRLADLDRDDAIGIGPGNSITVLLARQPNLPEALRSPHVQTHSTVAQLQLAQERIGFALLPVMAAKLLDAKDLTLRPVVDLDVQREIYLIQRSSAALSPAAELLKDAIIDSSARADRDAAAGDAPAA